MTNQAFLKKKPTGGQSCISGKSKSEQKSTTDSACKKNTWLCLSLSEILSTTYNTQLRWFSTLTCPMSLPHCAIFKARNVLYLESLSVFSQLPAIHWYQGCYSTFKHRHASILFQTGTQSSLFSIQGGSKIFFLESHSLLIDLPLPLAQVSVSR